MFFCGGISFLLKNNNSFHWGIKGEPIDETRNVLVEAARISRGAISPLEELNTSDFHVLHFISFLLIFFKFVLFK